MAYRSSAIGTGVATSTPSVAVPTGAVSGDIIILACTVDATSGSTLPAGFTQFGTDAGLTFDGETSQLAWKVYAGEAGPYNWTGAQANSWAAYAVAFSGRSGTPVASSVAQSNTGNASPVTATSNAVTVIAGDDLCAFFADDPTGNTTAETAGGSFTLRQSNGTTFTGSGIETLDNATPGSTTASMQFTASSTSAWQGWVVRIPAASSVIPVVFQPSKTWRRRYKHRQSLYPHVVPPNNAQCNIRRVQTTGFVGNAAASTTIAATLPNNVTAGNLLVAFAAGGGINTNTITFSSTGGPTWTNVAPTAFESGAAQVYVLGYAQNAPSGATTVTATFNGSLTNRGIIVVEYSGADTSTPLDVNTTGLSTGNVIQPMDNTLTTTVADGEMIVSGLVFRNATNPSSPGPGFSSLGADTAQVADIAMEDAIQSTMGPIVPSFFVTGGSQPSGIMSAAFTCRAAATPISLTDTVAITDALSVAAAVSLSDNVGITDALTVTVAVSLSDNVTITDALSVANALSLTDSVAITDALSVAGAISLTDTVALTDGLTIAAAVPLTDSVGITDVLGVAAAVPLTDSISITDVLGVSTGSNPSLTDIITISDSLSVVVTLALSDTVSIQDSLDSGHGANLALIIYILGPDAPFVTTLTSDAQLRHFITQRAWNALNINSAPATVQVGKTYDVFVNTLQPPNQYFLGTLKVVS